MFRTLSLLVLCATAAASDNAAFAKGETASLLQIHKPTASLFTTKDAQLRVNVTAAVEATVNATTAVEATVNATAAVEATNNATAAVEVTDNATADWSFHDIDFGDLLSSFDPQKLKDKINGILDDHDLNLDDLSQKLTNFTTKFQERMNETVTETQGQLQSMREQLETKGKAVKNEMLLETADKVTKLGDAAVNVAQKVTVKVSEARVQVQTLLVSLESGMVTEGKEALRKSLDAAVHTLSTFVHSLLQAVHLRQPTSLLTLTDEPDLFDRSIAKTKEVLQQTDDALASAEVYVVFVNRTIQDTKVQADALSEKLSQQADTAIDTGDALAQKLLDQLGDINDVLAGKFSADEVVAMNEKSSAPRAARVWLGFALLIAAFLS